MTIFCCVCKAEVTGKRVARGSHFCSEVCHEQYRRERRNLKAGKACRLCGRPPRQRRKLDPVPTAHNQILDLIEGTL